MAINMNTAWGLLGKIKGIFDGGRKQAVDITGDAFKGSAGKSRDDVEQFLRTKDGPLSEDDINYVRRLQQGVVDGVDGAKASGLGKGGWKTWATVGVAGTIATFTAQPLVSAALGAWNTAANEAGNTAFFHKIWDWLAKLMDDTGLSEMLPGARKWLGDRVVKNQGVAAQAWDKAKETLANPITNTLGINNPLPDNGLDTAAEYALIGGAGYGAYRAYNAFKGPGGDGGGTPTNGGDGPDGKGSKGAGFRAPNTGAAADAVEAVAEKGLASRLTGSFMKHAKGNVIATAALGAGLFFTSKAFGATNEEALDTSTSIIPFKDAFVHAEAGNTDAAIRSAAIDGAGIAGFTAGAAAGAAAGSFFFGVGAIPGAIIGGAVGTVTGIGSSMLTEYLWQEPAPAPTPVATLENFSAEFETAALDTTPTTPDYSNAWNGMKSDTRRNNKGGMAHTPAYA